MPYNKRRYSPVLLQGADLFYLTNTTTFCSVGWIGQLFPWSVFYPPVLLFIVFYMAALFRSHLNCLFRLLGMLGETFSNSLIINHQMEERSKHLVCVPA
jgi:hypothetical protein